MTIEKIETELRRISVFVDSLQQARHHAEEVGSIDDAIARANQRRELLTFAAELHGDITIAERRRTLPPASIDALRSTLRSVLADAGGFGEAV